MMLTNSTEVPLFASLQYIALATRNDSGNVISYDELVKTIYLINLGILKAVSGYYHTHYSHLLTVQLTTVGFSNLGP